MSYFENNTNWEEHFLQEAIEVEEKMKALDVESLNKSRLRIGIENNILSWTTYEAWYTERIGCSSLKTNLTDVELDSLISKTKEIQDSYQHFDIWSEDLLPFYEWDGQLIVIGLQYSEKLAAIPNCIFILAPPQTLSYISIKLNNSLDHFSAKSEQEINEESSPSLLDGIMPDMLNLSKNESEKTEIVSLFDGPSSEMTKVIELKEEIPAELSVSHKNENQISIGSDLVAELSQHFKNDETSENSNDELEISIAASGRILNSPNESSPQIDIWDFIAERHQEYSFEAKKQFSAFLVLKINQGKSAVFKADPELNKAMINLKNFEILLSQESPLKKASLSQKTLIVPTSQFNFTHQKFSHACVVPLKRGNQIVGFFVGLKNAAPDKQDQNLLEELAQETAA